MAVCTQFRVYAVKPCSVSVLALFERTLHELCLKYIFKRHYSAARVRQTTSDTKKQNKRIMFSNSPCVWVAKIDALTVLAICCSANLTVSEVKIINRRHDEIANYYVRKVGTRFDFRLQLAVSRKYYYIVRELYPST